MTEAYTITSLGDAVLLVDFGNRIDDAVNKKVLALFQQLQHFSPFILDVVPAYGSLAIYYDVLSLHTNEIPAFEKMKALLLPLLQQAHSVDVVARREITIPVCYASTFAPDLEALAQQKQLAVEEIIQLHTGKTYRVYMIGFLPGFPYLGKVDERIAAPRRNNPRTFIPAGSVGIAGEQTGIYPLDSPGGWNIIGRTPVPVFNQEKSKPVLLQPGDSVRFYSISEDEFENYQSRLA